MHRIPRTYLQTLAEFQILCRIPELLKPQLSEPDPIFQFMLRARYDSRIICEKKDLRSSLDSKTKTPGLESVK